MRIEGSSIPFHIARAYGIQATPKAAPVQAADPVERVSENVRRLVSGVVPGKVSFAGAEPMPEGAFAMYRHPADKNSAATAVNAGRMVDVTG
jgi:hypothetical protein